MKQQLFNQHSPLAGGSCDARCAKELRWDLAAHGCVGMEVTRSRRSASSCVLRTEGFGFSSLPANPAAEIFLLQICWLVFFLTAPKWRV